jgi:hypothetical protein
VAHWVTIYTIDTVAETITLADNDREFANQDFSVIVYRLMAVVEREVRGLGR